MQIESVKVFGLRAGRQRSIVGGGSWASSLIFALLASWVFLLLIKVPDEDAFISFIFARSLLEGQGLSYAGTIVEGYTNPLYTLLLAFLGAVFPLGIPHIAILLSFSLGVLSIYLYFSVLRRVDGSFLFESFVFLILIFSPTFTYWMLSGTENAFQISTLLAALLAFKKKRFVIGSFLLGLHGIIRFEAVVISGIVLIWIIISKRQLLFRTNKVAIYLGLVLIPFLMNTAFRWLYYDSLTPNTGVRKFFERSFQTRLIEGAAYVCNFLIETHIIIMLIVLLGFYWFKRAFIGEDLGLLVIAALWLLVVAFVGGDVNWKPHFRFCTGPFVLFTLFFAKSLFVSQRVGQYCLALWIGLILLVEPVFFEAKSFGFCQKKFRKYALGANTNLLTVVANNPRIDLIRGNLMDDSFKAVGRLISVLGFEGTLLPTGAGKVAFYSNMHAIDATGLADKEWRDGDRANRSKMLNEVNVIVFEAVPERASGFLSELRNLQGFKHFSLIAIVPQPYNPGGFLNLVFARRCLGEVKLPDRFGDDVEFVKHEGPTATAIYFVSGVTPKLKDRFIDQILATLKANELSAISLERH